MNYVNSEYIDIDDALKRVGGNAGLYHKLLGRFLDSKPLGELEKALEHGTPEEASRAVHSMKGVAANLSLIKLRAVSAELELLIKDGLDHTAKLEELKDVYNVTEQIISEIQS
ncbi:MAG: Hpt domain-containing protein [Oscillospiraceae bacterium]|nr:Hpt domain-containing protein [Oscillospiraceae bacterium]